MEVLPDAERPYISLLTLHDTLFSDTGRISCR
jgi:hypothetical protein